MSSSESRGFGLRTILYIIICQLIVILVNYYKYKIDSNFYKKNVRLAVRIPLPSKPHNVIVDEYFAQRKSWNLSKLGEVLFKNAEYPEKRNKTFIVLIWKYWERLQKRHVYYLGNQKNDPLNGCSVQNCEFSGDDDKLHTADAVVIHIFHAQGPSLINRNWKQRWVFLNDEAPPNVFKTRSKPPLSGLYNVFNWSMTFESYADVPVPSGRTLALKQPKFPFIPALKDLVPYWKLKRRDVLISIMMSNCHVYYRRRTIIDLKGHMNVNVYGLCGDSVLRKRCPNHFRRDCEDISYYLFYLVLENSKCRNYITEKVFHNAYSKGAIPVIQGPTIEECEQFLPPNSYLHLDNYATLKDLSDDLVRISRDEEALLSFHMWRNNFEVVNEHGYFGTRSFHLCRLCEALNYNDEKESVYDEKKINFFLNKNKACRKYQYFCLNLPIPFIFLSVRLLKYR